MATHAVAMTWRHHAGLLRSVVKGVCLSAALGIGLHPATASGQSNPIVLENQQPGTSAWRILPSRTGNDTTGQIKGYASATSVNKGAKITFHVSVNPAQIYTIDVYRIGWYQGLGGRLMEHIGPLLGLQQPACPTDATTGMIECHWTPAYTLTTRASWTSGIYLAVLTNAEMYQNYIVFAVRDDSRSAALLYQQPVTTYQAYNDYPFDGVTGKSLYTFNSYGATTVTGTKAAAKVSFDRPYLGDGTGIDWGNSVFSWEINFVRWMEKSGYDVTYSTDVDTHTNGGRLLNYRAILSVGHDEYWSRAMYDAAVAARDTGINLAFFGANALYTQIRFEPSSVGVPNRVIVCYRNATLDPVSDPSLKTVNWRNPLLNRPEQTMVGVQYTHQVQWQPLYNGYVPYVVTNSGHWVYSGTGFIDGDSAPGIVGYEGDRLFSDYSLPSAITDTYTLLSNSPFTSNQDTQDYANSSIYQAPSGAWVFGAGTIGWSRALDNFAEWNVVDPRIQQTTANILDRFVDPGRFIIAASPSTRTVMPGDSTSYDVTITRSGGFTGQVTLSASGLPSGATVSFTASPADVSSTLLVTTDTSTPVGTYTLTITGVSGTRAHTTTVGFVVIAPPDFTLSASPSSRTVQPGSFTTYSVTINSTGGFTGEVDLSVSGLPSGADGIFTPNPTAASSTLSVTTAAGTPVGAYTLTITGVGGSLTRSSTATFIVSAPPDFTLAASPSSRTVPPGGSTSYSVAINATGGFTNQVSLSVSGLPAGASSVFTPNPAATSSTLAVTTSPMTPTGAYTLAISGVGGGLTRTTTVSLRVTPVPGTVTYDNNVSSGVQFGVSTVTTPVFVVGSGSNRAAMIMIAMSANGATNITASLGGVSGTAIEGTDTGTTAAIRTVIFQVINPPPGPQTATVSWSNGLLNADVGVVTVSGADQLTPCTNGTFAASDLTPGQTTSVTIASEAGDLSATIGFTADAWATPFTNQRLTWGLDSGEVGGDLGPGTGTTTHTWTDQYLYQRQAVSGANFKASIVP